MAGVTITNKEEFQAWLLGKPHNWQITVAVRAALRVVPAWAGFFTEDRTSPGYGADILVLCLFRCLAVSRQTVLFASRSDLRTAARIAADMATKAISTSSKTPEEVTLSVLTALISSNSRLPVDYIYSVFDAALRSMFESAKMHNRYLKQEAFADAEKTGTVRETLMQMSGNGADASGHTTVGMAWSAIQSDAEELRSQDAQAVFRPLWRNSSVRFEGPITTAIDVVPAWATHNWATLKEHLGNVDDWQVWTDWYEAILQGTAPWGLSYEAGDGIMLAALTWPQEVWVKGPAHVNGEIAKLIDAAQRPPAPPIDLGLLTQSSVGLRFRIDGDYAALGNDAQADDIVAADGLIVKQLHSALRHKARLLADLTIRVDNQPGWTGIASVTTQFRDLVDCELQNFVDVLSSTYSELLTVASFHEQNLQAASNPSGHVDPLPLDIARALSDVIRTAAPMLRQFPTVLALDEHAGSFLTKAELFEPARVVLQAAAEQHVFAARDLAVLQDLVAAAERGAFQSDKARSVTLTSAKNLVLLAASSVVSFQMGMAGNIAAEKSIIARKLAETYIATEKSTLTLFASATPDIQLALKELYKSLASDASDKGTVTPAPRPVADRRRTDENKDDV